VIWAADAQLAARENHAILSAATEPSRVRGWLADNFPRLHLLSVGRSIDLFKDTGHPRESFRTATAFRSSAGRTPSAIREWRPNRQ